MIQNVNFLVSQTRNRFPLRALLFDKFSTDARPSTLAPFQARPSTLAPFQVHLKALRWFCGYR